MFGKRASSDPLNMRAIKRYAKVDANRMRAYDWGELAKAMELARPVLAGRGGPRLLHLPRPFPADLP